MNIPTNSSVFVTIMFEWNEILQWITTNLVPAGKRFLNEMLLFDKKLNLHGRHIWCSCHKLIDKLVVVENVALAALSYINICEVLFTIRTKLAPILLCLSWWNHQHIKQAKHIQNIEYVGIQWWGIDAISSFLNHNYKAVRVGFW